MAHVRNAHIQGMIANYVCSSEPLSRYGVANRKIAVSGKCGHSFHEVSFKGSLDLKLGILRGIALYR
jgi:hypothetical protein